MELCTSAVRYIHFTQSVLMDLVFSLLKDICSSRLCEAVLNDLIVEILDDITECIHSLAAEAFDREFNNSQ